MVASRRGLQDTNAHCLSRQLMVDAGGRDIFPSGIATDRESILLVIPLPEPYKKP